MKKILALSVLFSGLMVFVTSCYYDNVQDLYPDKLPCDTTSVTYKNTIAPIMSANCNVCHSGVTAQKSVTLDSYPGISVVVTDGLSGRLWRVVSHQPGITPMPYQNGSLSDCDLAKIRVWLRNGAPDN